MDGLSDNVATLIGNSGRNIVKCIFLSVAVKRLSSNLGESERSSLQNDSLWVDVMKTVTGIQPPHKSNPLHTALLIAHHYIMQLHLNTGTGRADFQTQCSSKLIPPITTPYWHKIDPADLAINVAERIPSTPGTARKHTHCLTWAPAIVIVWVTQVMNYGWLRCSRNRRLEDSWH